MANNDSAQYVLRWNDISQKLEYAVNANWVATPTPADLGITQLTGDVTAGPGSGSQVATLPTVNANVGTFTNSTVTVNAKGQVTAASSGTAPTTPSVVDSAATVGGAANESVVVTGLLTTSTIWAVTQRTKGGSNLPLLSWTNVLNGHLNIIYSADMGSGAIVRVLFIP